MAGFLDKDNRIIDMVLTGLGKELLAKGTLEFSFWTPFDDEVDYSPEIYDGVLLVSGSDYTEQKEAQIHETLVREATTGYKHLNKKLEDTTNVIKPLFDMPQAQSELPRLLLENTTSGSINVKQQRIQVYRPLINLDGVVIDGFNPIDIGVERHGSTDFSTDILYTDGSFPRDHKVEGVLVRVLKSGSDGYAEINHKRDLANNISFGNDLKLKVTK